jgi:hypothetical protein
VKHKSVTNYIEFFLVTSEGNEVLAITAEDAGNSHYLYKSQDAFRCSAELPMHSASRTRDPCTSANRTNPPPCCLAPHAATLGTS